MSLFVHNNINKFAKRSDTVTIPPYATNRSVKVCGMDGTVLKNSKTLAIMVIVQCTIMVFFNVGMSSMCLFTEANIAPLSGLDRRSRNRKRQRRMARHAEGAVVARRVRPGGPERGPIVKI